MKRFKRLLVLVGVFIAGFACAQIDLGLFGPGGIKNSAPVLFVFQSRLVKTIYYALKPTLGLGWTGRFNPARSGSGLTQEQEREIEALRAIGYVDGSQPAAGQSGVTLHADEFVLPGLNLETDGYQPQATLRDMNGRVLHQWQYTFGAAFPDGKSFDGEPGTYNWRRVKLFENGDLVAIFEGHGLIRLDRDSNLLWAYDGDAHHDVEVLPDGTIWVLTREAELLPHVDPDSPVLHDFLVRLDADGNELKKISLLKAIETSFYAPLIEFAPEGDLMHTNEIEVLDDRLSDEIPAFASGRLLLSVRNINTLMVLDPESEQVVWALSGLFSGQHSPVVLDNDRLLVFDNKGAQGRSRVVEIDPRTQRVHWSYQGGDFHSETCGNNQRLANGNTLIIESDYGRAFEVRPDKKIVWEFYTPDRTGENDELIATLFDLIRLPADFPLDWLETPPAG